MRGLQKTKRRPSQLPTSRYVPSAVTEGGVVVSVLTAVGGSQAMERAAQEAGVAIRAHEAANGDLQVRLPRPIVMRR